MRKLLPLVCLLAIASSCEKPAQIPSYIAIDSYDFSTVTSQGTASNKITDAWIYIDTEFQGAYELPCEVPVLKEGDVNVVIQPGIKMNGIAATRVSFPFYTEHQLDLNLTPDEVTTINPSAEYTSQTTFEWIEDMEDAGFSLEKTNSSDTSFYLVTGADAFEGNNSIGFTVDADHIFFEGAGTVELDVPKTTGHIIFLEMDYKADIDFTVGLFANEAQTTFQEQIVRLNATEEWNKIYINLTPNVLSHFNATAFKIFFGAILQDTSAPKSVYLDNIKVIYL